MVWRQVGVGRALLDGGRPVASVHCLPGFSPCEFPRAAMPPLGPISTLCRHMESRNSNNGHIAVTATTH